MKVSELPIGSKLVFGSAFDTDIVWVKVSDEQDFFAETSCGMKSFDAAEPTSSSRSRRNHGNNFFPQSNIMQWLNSRGESWFSQTHPDDVEPIYSMQPGFLTDFLPAEIEAIVPREITVGVPLGSRKAFGDTYKMNCMVSLPSAKEIGVAYTVYVRDEEGAYLPDLSRFIRDGRAGSVMTRTGVGDAGHIVAFHSWEFIKVPANRSTGVHPMVRLSPDLEITDTADSSDLRYVVVDDSKFLEEFFDVLSDT